MDSKFKAGVFNKIIKALKSNPNIEDIEKEQGESYTLKCKICGGIDFDFILRKDTDLLVIKSTTPVIPDIDESGLVELGAEMTEDSNIRSITYDGRLSFQLVVPCVSSNGVEGQKAIFNETLGMVHLMYRYKDRLGCNNASSGAANLDFTSEAEDDPYGFNDFSDDEDDGIPAPPADGADEDDGIFPAAAPGGGGGDDESAMDDAAFIFSGMLTMPETNQKPMDPETPGMEDGGIEDEVAAKLKEIERKKAEREKRRQERAKKKAQGKQPEAKAAPPDDEEEDIFSMPLPDTNIKGSKKGSSAKPKPHVKPKPPVGAAEIDDIFGNLFDDKGPGVATPEAAIPEAAAPKPEAKPRAGSRNGKGIRPDTSKTKTDAQSPANKKGIKAMESRTNISNGKGETPSPSIRYERAPEVVEQMKHLYAEVDQIFEQKKQQADYRQKTLDEYAERLRQTDRELAMRAERLEANYAEKQAEYEKMVLGFETQKQEIAFQWQKLDSEKEAIEQQRKAVEEGRELFEQEKKLANTITDEDDKAAAHKREIEEKNKEISALKDAKAEAEKEHEEQVKCLREEIEKAKAEPASSDIVDGLNAQVASLKEELEEMTDDLEDLTEETQQKDEIIQTLQRKQSEWKGKEAAWASKEAAWASKETAWASKEASYKKQVSDAKAAGTQDGGTALQDELDAANIRIKELEADLAKAGKQDSGAEVKRLEQEISKLKSDLDKADEAYEKMKKEAEQAASGKGAPADTNKLAVNIKDSLSDIGIEVEPVATNGELVLSGHSDSAQVVINVDAGILYIEKPVKRGIKYRAKFEQWNQEDIKTSYLFTEKKVICKCVYDDISKAAMEILGHFDNMN